MTENNHMMFFDEHQKMQILHGKLEQLQIGSHEWWLVIYHLRLLGCDLLNDPEFVKYAFYKVDYKSSTYYQLWYIYSFFI